jgi:hypothetical protein
MLRFTIALLALMVASVAAADLLAPQSVDFGDVQADTTAVKTISIINDSAEDLVNVEVHVGTPPQAAAEPLDWYTTSGCGGVIQSGQICSLTIYFNPSRNGKHPAFLYVSGDNSSGGEVLSIRANGKGI